MLSELLQGILLPGAWDWSKTLHGDACAAEHVPHGSANPRHLIYMSCCDVHAI
jgi:hypothetical protein